MKKLFIFPIIFLLSLSLAAQTGAQSPEPSGSTAELSITPTGSDSTLAPQVQYLKKRILNKITKTQKDLTKILAKITNDKKLSDESKTALTKMVNDSMTQLANLKSQINQAKDENQLKDILKKVSGLKIYSNIIPKIQLMKVTDKYTNLATTMTQFVTLLVTFETTLQAAGADTTKLDHVVNDMNQQIASISANLLDIKSGLTDNNATGSAKLFWESQRKLRQVRKEFSDLQQDLRKFKNEIRKIIKSLKFLLSPSPSIDVSPTETIASPSPS